MVELYVTRQDFSETLCVKQVVFEEKLVPIDDTCFAAPSLDIGFPAAQELFQVLWDSGFRPNDGEGTAGHVSAIKLHLEDMRKLTNQLLERVLKE
jgi:hypothetical protein